MQKFLKLFPFNKGDISTIANVHFLLNLRRNGYGENGSLNFLLFCNFSPFPQSVKFYSTIP